MSAPSTLQEITNKVRRVTGTPSTQQLTDTQIYTYINTFLLYDLPENLRLFQFHQPYIFYTQPNVDSYVFPRNEILTINPPVYIAGYYSFWTQSQEQFYRIYPQLNDIRDVAVGNGTPGPYTFTIPAAPILRGYTTPGTNRINSNVLISIDNSNSTPIARDDGVGGFVNENGTPLVGTIDYVTGAVTVTFDAVVASGDTITSQSVPYQPSRPDGLLFYNDVITLRPVPDKSYKVEVQSFRFPTELATGSQSPLLNEWFQYLAYGASKLIFEDRLDLDGWTKIQPFFDQAERRVLRRTIVQNTPERTSTIYTEMTQFPTTNYYNRF